MGGEARVAAPGRIADPGAQVAQPCPAPGVDPGHRRQASVSSAEVVAEVAQGSRRSSATRHPPVPAGRRRPRPAGRPRRPVARPGPSPRPAGRGSAPTGTAGPPAPGCRRAGRCPARRPRPGFAGDRAGVHVRVRAREAVYQVGSARPGHPVSAGRERGGDSHGRVDVPDQGRHHEQEAAHRALPRAAAGGRECRPTQSRTSVRTRSGASTRTECRWPGSSWVSQCGNSAHAGCLVGQVGVGAVQGEDRAADRADVVVVQDRTRRDVTGEGGVADEPPGGLRQPGGVAAVVGGYPGEGAVLVHAHLAADPVQQPGELDRPGRGRRFRFDDHHAGHPLRPPACETEGDRPAVGVAHQVYGGPHAEPVQEQVQVVDEGLEPVAPRRPPAAAVPAVVVHDHVQAGCREGGGDGEVIAGQAVGQQPVEQDDRADRARVRGRGVRRQALDVQSDLAGVDDRHAPACPSALRHRQTCATSRPTLSSMISSSSIEATNSAKLTDRP